MDFFGIISDNWKNRRVSITMWHAVSTAKRSDGMRFDCWVSRNADERTSGVGDSIDIQPMDTAMAE